MRGRVLPLPGYPQVGAIEADYFDPEIVREGDFGTPEAENHLASMVMWNRRVDVFVRTTGAPAVVGLERE